ncbi:MAG: BON domain-containing protein [Candidatus Acidiferrales bacterium]
MMQIRLRLAMRFFFAAAFLLVSASCVAAGPQQSGQPASSQANQLVDGKTDQPKSSLPDVDITRQIQRSIAQDKTLSTYARHIKVVTRNCSVTLTGTVKSQEEKGAIAAKAAEVVGRANIVNKLEVAAKQPTS